jgi:histidine triad (HIT) family protein
MEDIFDKIIAGSVPSFKIYEDSDVLAFLDITQVTKGHSLLIPKKHLENIYAYSDDDAKNVLSKIPIIARAIKKGLPDVLGINIISNNEIGAGQSVLHSHFHFVPRYLNDEFSGPNSQIDNSSKYSNEDMQVIADLIKGGFNE